MRRRPAGSKRRRWRWWCSRLGRLIDEAGTGDGTASRTLGYDPVGNTITVDHPDGTIGFEYDDRNLLTGQTGPAGTVSFDYDTAGRLTGRVDAAGTHTYTWTPRGEIDTLVEPITGTTLDYTWDDASQPTSIAYGVSAGVRGFSYDDLGRLSADTLTDTTPVTTAMVSYGYDSDGNLISRDVTLPGNSDAGLDEYVYDNAGRLASWTQDTTTVDYVWDGAGNRITAGSDAYTYDQRNRLLTGPDGTYTYTPRGTLSGVDDGTTPVVYDFDSLGRLSSIDTVEYAYDGLDRVADREGIAFTYQGFSLDPVTDGVDTYARTPGGRMVGISDGTSDLLVGLDRHGDLTHLFEADGTVTDTIVYDPYGDPLASTGSFDSQVGYQGDWTDPTSGHVWMGARWYEGSSANFLSRDTVLGELTTPVSLNRYTYGWANPLKYWDPTGQYVTVDDGIWYGDRDDPDKPKAKPKADAQVEKEWLSSKTKAAGTASSEADRTKKTQDDRRGRGHKRAFPYVFTSGSYRGWNSIDQLAARANCNFLCPITSSMSRRSWDTGLEAQSRLRGLTDSVLLDPLQFLSDRLNDSSQLYGSTLPGQPPPSRPQFTLGPIRGYESSYGEGQLIGIGLTVAVPAALGRAGIRGLGAADDVARVPPAIADDVSLHSPSFIAHPNGQIVPVPRGAVGPTPTETGRGFQFTGGSGGYGLDPRVTDIRVMDPVTGRKYTYPQGYVTYGNGSQTVNPWTGQTVSNADPLAHWPWSP